MKNKINLLALVLSITSILVVLLSILAVTNTQIIIVSNFEDCKKAGFTILQNIPRQCKTLNGKVFTEYGLVRPVVDPVFCTADAKICPNGSAVGRNNKNNCEFYPCP